jgi:hypothetical protein
MNKQEVQMLNQKEYDALLIATSLREFNGYENTEELITSLNSAMDKITKDFTKRGIEDATDFETRKQQEVK